MTDTGGLTPTFTPPDNVDADTDYDYTVTMTSGGSDVASADVTVTVLNTPPSIACTATPDRVYEGSGDDVTVSCSAQNEPSVPFIYAWSGTDDFINLFKGWNGDWPIFGAAENGREAVVEDSEGSPLADLSQVVDIYPGVVVLMPGEKGLMRYGVQEGALARTP